MLFLVRLAHDPCFIWRRFPVSFGVETLSHLAFAGCVIWRMLITRVLDNHRWQNILSPARGWLCHLSHCNRRFTLIHLKQETTRMVSIRQQESHESVACRLNVMRDSRTPTFHRKTMQFASDFGSLRGIATGNSQRETQIDEDSRSLGTTGANVAVSHTSRA